jgi:hypothetical protein
MPVLVGLHQVDGVVIAPDTIEELRAALVEFAIRYSTKPGSSPGTAIVHQPRCEPINAGLIRTLRPT